MELMEQYGKGEACIPRHEERTVAKLAVVLGDFLRGQLNRLCKDAGSRPLLWCYGSDLTPYGQAISHAVDGGR